MSDENGNITKYRKVDEPLSSRKPKRVAKSNQISRIDQIVRELPQCQVDLENLTSERIEKIICDLRIHSIERNIKSLPRASIDEQTNQTPCIILGTTENDSFNVELDCIDMISRNWVGDMSKFNFNWRQDGQIELEFPFFEGDPKVKYIFSKDVLMNLFMVISKRIPNFRMQECSLVHQLIIGTAGKSEGLYQVLFELFV